MSDVAVRVEDVGKAYQMVRRSGAQMLRRAATWPLRRLLNRPSAFRPDPLFWALRHTSFEVRHGEVLGIIGRNGAGKSTLLKLLARITAPSEGRIEIHGRVGSLLEVGTGFHPELTGRENVYLNGGFLGMNRAEVRGKFNQIAEFAEIGKFIDQPVKTYSSGMYTRLAFAVAAHLDPEILIVDEVLSVGDAAFQTKCLGKMGEVAQSGRTIFFVSHSMSAVRRLCQRCIWLDKGQLKADATPDEVIELYLKENTGPIPQARIEHKPDADAQVTGIRVISDEAVPQAEYENNRPLTIEFQLLLRRKHPGLYICTYLRGATGDIVFFSDSRDSDPCPTDMLGPGSHEFRVSIPPRTLNAGRYYVTVGVADYGGVIDACRDACQFSLRDLTSRRPVPRPGYFGMHLKWDHTQFVSEEPAGATAGASLAPGAPAPVGNVSSGADAVSPAR